MSNSYVKQVQRCATVAFSPTSPYIATATMAGAIDLSFSTTACLEVFKVDYSKPSADMPLAGGAVAATERFHRLVWGPTGSDTEGLSHGVIAGGLVDGSVNLYNPAKIIGSPIGEEPTDGPSGAVITKLQKHTGPVRGLEFNSFSPNLLASGAEDGELCIWDLANPAQPSLYPALKSGAGGPGAGEVSYLAWNKKVQHILASSSLSGTTVVWDLKRQRPVISFTDPNSRRRCSALQWNPEVATQLIVASDDDRSPSLQIWDLRNSISPARELVAHSKGVLAMAWSIADPGLLLTCGKDNRTLCWDTAAGEVLAELPASSNWNFDVQWSPVTPGVLSTSSFDGRVGLYNLQQAAAVGGGGTHGVASDFSGMQHTPGAKTPMKRAPAWMKRPCGATFGFGGQLATFGANFGAGEMPAAGTISTLRVTNEEEPAATSEEFEGAVASGSSDALKEFCMAKRASAEGANAAEEAETWAFMEILFADDARRELLKHLDFGDALDTKAASEAEAMAKAAAPAESEPVTELMAPPNANGSATAPLPAAPPPPPPPGDGVDFFDNMADDDAATVTPPSPLPPPATAAADPEPPTAVIDGDVLAADFVPDAADLAVQKALVVGDYRAAVEACMAAGRHADALVIASVGGPELWQEVQEAHFKREARRPYMKLAAAVVAKDLQALVEQRPVMAWRETLAMLSTYAPAQEWGALAGVLAARLSAAGDSAAATLCHVCAGDVDAAVGHWLAALPAGKVAPAALHAVIEKAIILTHATGQGDAGSGAGGGVAQLVVSYAETLAAQGQLSAAITYLDMVPGSADNDAIAVLRDRIVRGSTPSAASGSASSAAAPTVTPAQTYQQQQYQQQPQQQTYNHNTYAQHHHQQQVAYSPAQAQATPAYPSAPQPYGSQQQQQQQQSSYSPAPPQPAYSAPAAYDTAPVQSAYGAPQGYGAHTQSAPAPPPTQPTAMFNPTATSAPPTTPPPAAAAAAAVQYGAPPAMPAIMVPSQPSAATQPPTTVAAAPAFDVSAAAPPPVPTQPQAQPPAQAPPPQQPAYQPQQFQQAAAPPPRQPAYQPQQYQQQAYQPHQAPMQPMQPAQQQLATPAAPPPPPAKPQPPTNLTMENVDASKVAAEHQPVVRSLKAFYGHIAQAVAGNPARAKELADSSKRLAGLLFKLNMGDVSPGVCTKLLQMCAALDAGDIVSASAIQVGLTTTDWDEGSSWLTALKRLLKMRQTMG